MTTAARISLALAVCFFLALYGVIVASPGVSQEPTVQEAYFWKAAGCDELCLHQKRPHAVLAHVRKHHRHN